MGKDDSRCSVSDDIGKNFTGMDLTAVEQADGNDAFFNHLRYTTTDPIPTAIEAVTSTPRKVFFNDDGSAVIVVLEGIGITDPFAVQVSAP